VRALRLPSIVLTVCLFGASGAVLPAWADQEQGLAETAAQELVADADALLATLDQTRSEALELGQRRKEAQGEARELLSRQSYRKAMRYIQALYELSENVLEQERAGLDASSYREVIEARLIELPAMGEQRVAQLEESLAELHESSDSAPVEELQDIEDTIAGQNSKLDQVYDALLRHADQMEAMDLDGTELEGFLAEQLSRRATRLASRTEFAVEQRNQLENRLAETPGDSAVQARLHAVGDKLAWSTSSLEVTIRMLKQLGLETASYSTVLVQATGSLTTDVLDTQVALGLARRWAGQIKDWALDNGPNLMFRLLVLLAILLVFRILAGVARKVVKKGVARSNLSLLFQKTIVSWTSKIVMLIGLLVGLSQLGISLGPLLAGLGVAGFIVGFALQDTLSNFAAGMMLLVYRPYDVGDLIEAAGVFGKVNAQSLVSTTILTLDHQTLVVPNSMIWGNVIKNVTAQRTRRVDMTFGISYSDDIPHAERILESILAEHDRVLDNPEPMVRLHTLGESSVDFVVRPWVETDDYWDVYWYVTREVKMRFDAEGISIPFPQRDVHLYEEKVSTAD